MKNVTVFGSSMFDVKDNNYEMGVKIGKLLAEKKYTVKCGGYYGSMEAVAKGVSENGGECIGITNKSFDPKIANKYISLEKKGENLFKRLEYLVEDSDIFIVQIGSFGTLTELFLVWCLAYTKTILNKKILLIGKEWTQIIEALKALPIQSEDFNYVKVIESINELEKEL